MLPHSGHLASPEQEWLWAVSIPGFAGHITCCDPSIAAGTALPPTTTITGGMRFIREAAFVVRTRRRHAMTTDTERIRLVPWLGMTAPIRSALHRARSGSVAGI